MSTVFVELPGEFVSLIKIIKKQETMEHNAEKISSASFEIVKMLEKTNELLQKNNELLQKNQEILQVLVNMRK